MSPTGPRFDPPLVTGAPNRVDRAALTELIDGALDRRRLTNDGPLVRELEERLGAIVGGEVVAVANGTLALTIAGGACGITGRVAVPSWTFVGTAHAVRLLGGEPVFVDVDDDHVLDPVALDRVATATQVDAVMPVHLFGRACDVAAIGLVAAGLGVPVLYDAAQAVGTVARGRPIGEFGTASAFSLHATKWFSTVEGGLITTADAALADECRAMRNFGITGPDAVPEVGTNAKMSELHAAYGLALLERFDDLVLTNDARYEAYRSVLETVPGVKVVDTGEPGSTARPYVVIELDETHRHLRDPLREALALEGVETRRYFYPGIHRLEAYRHVPIVEPLRRTERLAASCLALPSNDAVSPAIAVDVAELVAEVLADLAATTPPALENMELMT